MKRLFLSDLHLGDFNSKADKIIWIVNDEKPDEIYLVGDIVDLWKNRLSNIQQRHQPVFSMLYRISFKTRIVYIIGNHDEKLNRTDNYFRNFFFCESCEITIGDKRARIIHGHQYDDQIMKHYPFSLSLNFIHKIFIKTLKVDFKKFRFSLSSKKKRRNFSRVLDKIKEKVIKDNEEFDILIMGHTHVSEQSKLNKISYFNVGDWIENCTYAVEEEGKVCLKSF